MGEVDLKVGQKWRHSGNGLVYEIIGVGTFFNDDEKIPTVIHKGEDGQVWIRSVNNFTGLRNGISRFTRED